MRKSVLVAGVVALVSFGGGGVPSPAVAQTSDLVSRTSLRVCADPANYPQSSKDRGGYENEIAELMAAALELEKVEYFWFPMSTGFVRNTLAAVRCDVIMGYSAGHELVLNTNPYLTSAFVLIAKPDSRFADVDSLADPRLKDARIGIVAGTQPANHLAYNGLLANIEPYQLFVDRRYANPNQDMADDLASGKIDVAIMWGPIGGALMKAQHADYVITPLLKEQRKPVLFARITMGVRQGETEWKRRLNSQIRRKQGDIDAILRKYGVPLLNTAGNAVKE